LSESRIRAIFKVHLLTFYSYLNSNCESEGLYRVPGSGPQVKHWQRRFDQGTIIRHSLEVTELTK